MGYKHVTWKQREGDVLQVLEDYVVAVSITQILAGLRKYGLSYTATQILPALQNLMDEGRAMRIIVRGRHFWKVRGEGRLW